MDRCGESQNRKPGTGSCTASADRRKYAIVSVEVEMTKDIKIIVEQHSDGFVAYPVGLRGVIIGQGETRAEAIADVTSAIQFHVETFGVTELEMDEPLLGVFVADTQVAV
jgi:Uncharacterized conserved protein